MDTQEQTERLIISLNEESNFRIYSPAYPTRSYTVSGTPEGPKCTCPDFENHKSDPEWKCQHMLAVLNLLNKSSEPVPVQNKEPQSAKEENVKETVSGLQMQIKRSVSPDGKINSLSVKVLYPVEGSSPSDIKEEAERVLGIVSEIIEDFKGEDIRGPEQRSRSRIAAMALFRRRCLA